MPRNRAIQKATIKPYQVQVKPDRLLGGTSEGRGSNQDALSSHGDLAGLSDDDHTQYHNNARGDARYYLKAQVDALVNFKHKYMVPVWAEENSTLGATNTYEWAYGNGASTPSDGGVTIFVPSGYTCQVVALTLRLGSGTANVELVLNGTPQGTLCDVTCTSPAQSATNSGFTPVSVSNNDFINFRTVSSSSTSSPNVVCAFLEYNES